MSSKNFVWLEGNLGQDPDLRYTASGKAVLSFSIATNSKWADGSEHTEWHKIVAWQKAAEILGDGRLKKGSHIDLEGRLQTRSWEDKEGNKRYTTEVVVNTWRVGNGIYDTETTRSGGGNFAPHPAETMNDAPVSTGLPPAQENPLSPSPVVDDDKPLFL